MGFSPSGTLVPVTMLKSDNSVKIANQNISSERWRLGILKKSLQLDYGFSQI